MNDSAGTNHQKGETLTEIPIVDWNDLESNRAKVLEDIRFALSECGFMILANAPGLHDAFQQRAFREVRRFYDSSDEIKASADIAQTPYFRGYSGLYLAPEGQCASIEIYQYSIDQEPVSAHDDENFPLYDRIMKGPNIWPKTDTLPGFQPAVDELCDVYFKLTHMLSELIVESLGEDPAHFRKYFDIDNPYLHASLNHNRSLSVFPEEARQWVMAEYARFDSDPDLVGTHIDGPPFITLLTNDRPGLQVVAGEGNWINAPVTCRTGEGEYPVPVIPGSVIVNTGGTLMHMSEGRYGATLHRVNTTLIPEGETRISLPFFLFPNAEGDLVPFGKPEPQEGSASGYDIGRDRGANACVNRMYTFPQTRERWWQRDFDRLWAKFQTEDETERTAAYDLAAERGERYKAKAT